MTAGERPVRDAEEELSSLDRAIEALEGQRAVLGDQVVDTALEPLRARRATAEARLTGEQRKLVTVLFADLVGFTELSRALDAEDTRAVVGGCFTRWREVIEAHGGAVEKFIGDAVMAVFGLHQALEDDAQRAVRAALAMTDALGDLRASVQQEHGVTLQMRVGVDTGDVVVSTLDERPGHDFVAVGQTVNRASRLQAAAPPGGVLVSADCHRQIRGRFGVQAVPGLRLKGIDEPVDAFLVRSERPAGFHLDRAGGVEGVTTGTVGREVELSQLQQLLLDVVADSRWRVVTVLGDAGVGKSRLLLELDRWLGERPGSVWWFRGRASHSGQNRPHALLRDLMATRLGIQESDPPDVVRDKCERGMEETLGAGPAARRTGRLVGVWLGFELGDDPDDGTPAGLPHDPQRLRDEATARLAEYFAALSSSAPVVILLEDLHWADDASLRWVDAAHPLLQARPVLVVATARPTLLERRPDWSEGLEQHVRLQLEPLSSRGSRQLFRELLHLVPHVPAALEELVVGTAEGNPFYIEELVTWLIDEGVVVRDAPAWRVVEQLVPSVRVPSTLRGVLQARLDALPRRERVLLQRASVVGRVFWDDAVDHLDPARRPLSSDPSLRPSAAPLAGLLRRQVVFERELSAFEATREFLFKHALLRDVAYEGVLRRHRMSYHLLAARWLTEVTERSARADEYAALIAQHFDRAGDPAAAAWYLRAGRQAASVYALSEGRDLLSRALEVLPDADATVLRFDVLAAREALLDRMGDRQAQRSDLAAMGDLAAGLDSCREVLLLLARSRWSFGRSEYDDAVRWAHAALETAVAGQLVVEAAEASLWWGKALTWRGDHDDARRVLTDAVESARAGRRPDLEGEALRYLSMVAGNVGDYPTAGQLLEQAREVLVRYGDTQGESLVLAQLSTVHFNTGHLDEARSCLEQALPIFRLSGHRYREGIALGNLATIASSQGELALARRWAHESLATAVELEDQELTVTLLNVLGLIALTVGDWSEADRQLQHSLSVAERLGSHPLAADALIRLSFLALEQGDVDRAVELGRRAAAEGELSASGVERSWALLALGYAELSAGALPEADHAFRRARRGFASLHLDALVREGLTGSAVTALLRGDGAAALDHVAPLLGHLDPAGLEGSLRPGRVLRGVLQVLNATGDVRARAVAKAARAYLLDRADAVGDERMRAGYLAVPVNAELLAPRAVGETASVIEPDGAA